jgi:hypothetical protein
MAGISMALSLSSSARHRTEAATLAQGKVDELVAEGGLQAGQLTGDFGEDWPEYRWVATVQDWNGTLSQLDVEVFWTSRLQERSVVISTLTNTAIGAAANSGNL